MSIIDTIKKLLPVKGQPDVPLTEHPLIPKADIPALMEAYDGIVANRAMHDLEMQQESDRYLLRQRRVDACRALLQGIFGGIPEEFHGLYRTVPGLFSAKIEIFDGDSYPLSGRKVPTFRLDLRFVPVLWGGVIIKHEWYTDLHLGSHNVNDIEGWPEDQPWPGTRIVGSYSDLKRSE